MLKNNGFTLIEVILTLTILTLVIMPLMSMLVFAAKINNESDREYKSFLAAQSCMEEIKALNGIDAENYIYNNDTGAYERTVTQTDDEFGAEIRIVPESAFYYLIDISILDNGEVINTLRGSMIVK
ncbi:prepilin-type N-terminal cleavage/methylation domain-containing protein [Sedimentibacter sp.]|uniref:type IV pilus modification PilV family protein n=1 Tax=Sedimentibacter sp. TaxID=1960295 RepID=UPI0028ADCCD3|nr:prepilin-type N-terminal cleavage/methylation domain-containing protein [Sedimentibacter sp.]